MVGKTKEKYLELGEQDFLNRLKPYAKVNFREIKNEKAGTIEEIKTKEGQRILGQIKKDSFKIALSEKGQMVDSKGFANLLNKAIIGKIDFIIGGAYGLSSEVLKFRPADFPGGLNCPGSDHSGYRRPHHQ